MSTSQPVTRPQSQQIGQQQLPQRPHSNSTRASNTKRTIYDRNLNRSRNAELSRSSFAYLFGEMVSYAQKRVTGIADLEKR